MPLLQHLSLQATLFFYFSFFFFASNFQTHVVTSHHRPGDFLDLDLKVNSINGDQFTALLGITESIQLS